MLITLLPFVSAQTPTCGLTSCGTESSLLWDELTTFNHVRIDRTSTARPAGSGVAGPSCTAEG